MGSSEAGGGTSGVTVAELPPPSVLADITYPPPFLVRVNATHCQIVGANLALVTAGDGVTRSASSLIPCPRCWIEQDCHREIWDGSRLTVVEYTTGERESWRIAWPD